MTQIEQEHTGLATLDTSTEAVEALLKDVTEGPWRSFSFEDTIGVVPLEPTEGDIAVCSGFSSRRVGDGQANSNFIAAARELAGAGRLGEQIVAR